MIKEEIISTFTSGIGVVSVGHGNQRLADAISDQARHIIHTSNLYMIEPQARLAKKINELTGFDVGVFFGNSGAEANEGAIKLARKYGEKKFANKKYKVLTLEHSISWKNHHNGQSNRDKQVFIKVLLLRIQKGFPIQKRLRILLQAPSTDGKPLL